MISEWLPAQRGDAEGIRSANADPVTGQAAWYDLRVRVEKVAAGEAGRTAPHFETLPRPPRMTPATRTLRYGEKP